MHHFVQVVLVGTGRVASACLESILAVAENVTAIEPEEQAFSIVKPLCAKRGVPYLLLPQKRTLAQYFLAIDKPTLVVSAHNLYIFPAQVLANRNLNVVNFHNSLLPRHAGRNAPSWAIFDLEDSSGVTWHQVSPDVDRGDVIVQRSIPITPQMTAIDLTKACAETGVQTFREILPDLLRNQYSRTPQTDATAWPLHRSGEIPNLGMLDMSWGAVKTSAFLRAMDYGKLGIFPKPRVRALGADYVAEQYRIDYDAAASHDAELQVRDNALSIREGSVTIHVRLQKIGG